MALGQQRLRMQEKIAHLPGSNDELSNLHICMALTSYFKENFVVNIASSPAYATALLLSPS